MPHGRGARSAILIYGGVSLVVYFDGVVQELLHIVLLHMVRATVDGVRNPGLLERVYREIACRFGLRADVRERVRDAPGQHLDPPAREPHTLLVVDIHPRTSADGINSVEPGEAPGGVCSLKALAEFRLAVADIGKLLNEQEVHRRSADLRSAPEGDSE